MFRGLRYGKTMHRQRCLGRLVAIHSLMRAAYRGLQNSSGDEILVKTRASSPRTERFPRGLVPLEPFGKAYC